MKTCKKCQKDIPTWVKIGTKKVNTQRRKFCYDCSPYLSHNTKDLTERKIPNQAKRKRKTSSADVQKFREKRKIRVVMAMGGKCQCCSYNACNSALELHHIDPSQKEFSCGSASANPIKWEKLIIELRKCVMLCSNCHKEVHAGIRTIPDDAKRFDENWIDYKIAESKLEGNSEVESES